mgnify:CR=1 FL=1
MVKYYLCDVKKRHKRRVNFILINWVKYCTKEVFKTLKIVLIGFSIITAVAVIKYKPVYAVTLSGKTIGYVVDKEKTEKKVNNYINDKEGNVAFRIANALPQYNLVFVSRAKDTNERQVLLAVQDNIVTTYETYAITLDGEKKAEVSSEAEAMQIIEEIKAGVSEEVGMTLGIVTEYTNDFKATSKEEALASLNEVKTKKVAAYETKKAEEAKAAAIAARKRAIASTTQVASTGAISGLQLSIPVTGSISSRFGTRGGSRSGAHTGLDISTQLGTGIRAIASGTVTYAGYKGSYGNLLIIDHGNGIQSYYAHCNELYVGIGASVNASTTIASVGSTGNSTGPHLHLEIRVNGAPVNPQQYLY